MTTKRLGFLGITGTVSTAYIGQRALLKLEGHPILETVAFIADDPADVGKTLGEAIVGRWQAEEPLPARYHDHILIAPEPAALKAAELDIVISTLYGPKSKQYDPILAAAGIAVVSESAGLRAEPDVPLIVPEINADHLGIIRAQQQARGFDKGFMVSAPLCTAVIIALAIKPFLDTYGLRSGVVTTLQALSGAGRTGVAALQVLDNLIPFINQEEDKLHSELPKILGTYSDGQLTPHKAVFTTTATRVPVRDGHTCSITLGLDNAPDLDAAPSLISEFRGAEAAIGLVHATQRPLLYRPEHDRPQPLLDRAHDNRMAVSVGRIRPAPVFDNGIGFVAVGDNHGRGTYGNTVLLAELVTREFLLS
jgi:aspartate-semialdehyde dehydrogenase